MHPVLLALLWISGAFDIPERVREYIRQRVDYGYERSIVIGMVGAAGETLVAYGVHHEGGPAAGGRSLYEIGSISKVLTATLLVDAVRRGEVGLDDPIQKYLPDHVRMPAREGQAITLRHLAMHTSALPRMPSNFTPADPANPYADYRFEQLYTFLGEVTLSRDIGSQYEYSNLGMGLLGHVLERVTGKSYETLINERIAGPLGMTDTVVRFRPDQQKRVASGHDGDQTRVSNWDLPTLAGAGALRATAVDMMTFLKANLGLIETHLEDTLLTTQATQHEVDGGTRVGLGWHIRIRDEVRIVWHNGGTGGYRTYSGFDPERRLGVVVLTNSTIGADDLGIHLLDPTHPLPKVYRAMPLATEAADEFVGSYTGAEPTLMIRREGEFLVAQRMGRSSNRIYPLEPDRFFYKTANILISFTRDEAGKVNGAVFDFDGVKIQYTRQN